MLLTVCIHLKDTSHLFGLDVLPVNVQLQCQKVIIMDDFMKFFLAGLQLWL